MLRISVLAIALFFLVAAASAQPRPAANVLLILGAPLPTSTDETTRKIAAHGGRADHIFPPDAIIAYVPQDRWGRLKTELPIARVEVGSVDENSFRDDSARLAARVWNARFQTKSPAPLAKSPARKAPGPVRIAPDRPVLGADLRTAPSKAAAPAFFQTSEYFIGSVTVGIILPESNGSIDTNRENWSISRQDAVIAAIAEGLQWWKDNLHAPANLSFVYDVRRSVPTGYEPIRRNSWEEGLWIGQVMANLGYPSGGGSYFTQVRNYLNAKRAELGSNWAFAIFVVDSRNDTDGEFPDGFFAYSYLNGPLMIMTYDNANWGIDLMQLVAAHETAHIFGALDEYGASGCSDSETSGYLDIANTNCENGTPATEDSIMRNASNQEFVAYPNHLVSTPVRQMIGWRDSDGDGKELYDPVDTAPLVFLSSYSPDPTTDRTPTYTGTAVDIAFDSPAVPDVTINKIATVEWRVNGGPWQQATAADEAFDSDTEDFVFTSTQLLAGVHSFEVRATNSAGNTSLVVADTLTVSPNVPVNCATASLQETLSMTGAGDTVTITGACNENIVIRNETTRITLDGGGTASIQGAGGSPALTLRGKGILIQNLTVSGGSVGIHVNRGSNAVINNSVIQNSSSHGVVVDQLAFAVITNSTIQNHAAAGVMVSEASTARVGFNDDSETDASTNTITNNGVGILISNDSSARVVGNSINANTADGITVIRGSSADIASNQIGGNGGDGIFVGENSAVQLGADSGTSIFESPNTSAITNTGFGVSCADGSVVAGRLGSLVGVSGAIEVALSCSAGIAP